MKRGYVFAIIMFFIMMSIIINFYVAEEQQMEHPALNKETLSVGHLLEYSLDHIRNENFDVAVVEIDNAVHIMNLIKIDADKKSDVLIDNAVNDLLSVANEISNRLFDQSHVKESFAKALYVLVYVHLKIAKDFAHDGNADMALFSGEMAAKHLKTAMRFSNETVMVEEKNLQKKIDYMLKIDNSEEFSRTVDSVLSDLDTTFKVNPI